MFDYTILIYRAEYQGTDPDLIGKEFYEFETIRNDKDGATDDQDGAGGFETLEECLAELRHYLI